MIKQFLLATLRPLSVVMLMLMPFLLGAAPRSAAEALKLAEKQANLINPAAGLTQAEPATRNGAQNYFVFNISDNNGYVIVSADDRFQDILGYADSGNFADALKNPSFEFWMSRISDEMAKVSVRSAATRSAGNPPVYKKIQAPDVAPLLESKWGQGEPFNNACPTWNGYPTVTGCVATAMAQVLYYHKWPQYYVNGDETFEYKWDLMLPEYPYGADVSEESKDQVAQLMSHCGISVNMSYGTGASSAYSFDVPAALVNNFNYDAKKMKLLCRDLYGYDEIHKILFNEFKEGRPVLASGSYPQSDLGHEFVLDGCNADGFIHVNWGWNGYCDGYFRLTSMRPDDFSTGGSEEGYSFDMDLTVGIQPNKDLEPGVLGGQLAGKGDLALFGNYDTESPVELYYGNYAFSDDYFYFPVTTKNAEYNGIHNVGAGTVDNARFATKLVNQATGEETVCFDSESYNIIENFQSGYYYYWAPLTYTDPAKGFEMEDGVKYAAYLGYIYDGEDTFNEVTFSPNIGSCLILEKEGTALYVTEPEVSEPILGEFPEGLARIERKGAVNFRATFRNDTDVEYVGRVKWKFLGENDEDYMYDYATDFLMLDLLPGESITEDFTLYKTKELEPGTYRIGLFDFRDRLISEILDVELYDRLLTIDETNFPDPEFRNFISLKYDQNRDGSLNDDEIGSIYYMTLEDVPLTNLKGVENFYNIHTLYVPNSSITELELSGLPALYFIYFNNAPIETVRLSDLPSLSDLIICNTQLKELDLSEFNALENIDVSWNPQLESLKLPDSAPISYLQCAGCNLSSLDVSKYGELVYLNCEQNSISELDLSNHPNMTNIRVGTNRLQKLDISDKTDLVELSISYNNIEGTLDVSHCENLYGLFAASNSLSELILGEKPELEYLVIQDNLLEGELDLTGMEKLYELRAYNNKFNKVIFGNNPGLENVDISFNEIEGTLDISGLPAIRNLFVNDNKISDLKYSSHPQLGLMYIQNNSFTYLHLEELFPTSPNYLCFNQEISMEIPGNDFDVTPLIEKGLDMSRVDSWYVFWDDDRTSRLCTLNGNIVEIPADAPDDASLKYYYLVDTNADYRSFFTIRLSRNGSGSVDGILADGSFSVKGNRIEFAEGISGEVYTPAGVRVFSGAGSTESLNSDIYIVRVGSDSVKIALK